MYHTIKSLYPSIRDDEFALQDDGEGPYIVRWSRPEPKPTVQEIALATPVAEFAALKAAELAAFDTRRDRHLNRLTGIGFRAKERADLTAVAAIVAASDALLDLPTHQSVAAATDITTLKTAIRNREAEIFNALPTAVKAALKKI